MRLVNKRAIVTGGSSGIGQAIAIAFAQEGADVVITYQQNKAGADETLAQIQQLGRQVQAVKVNVSSHESLATFIKESNEFLGGIDILVNNAGTLTRCKDFLAIPIEEVDLLHQVNYRAPFILTQLVAKQMKNQGTGGSIINISSVSTELVAPGFAHYEGSKAALNMLTKSAASELAAYQIRVNAISPGLVATAINADQHQTNTEVWQKRCSKIPLKRAAEPCDITPFAVLLASDESSWTTGTIIHVDGGMMVNSHFK